jgi:polysaccharide export outer membrane protein
MRNLFTAAFFSPLALALFLTSCSTQNLFQSGSPKGQGAESAFFSDKDYKYTIRKDDKITLGIWNNEDISVGSVYGVYNSSEEFGKWLLVDANGEIPVPQIGNLRVEGLTLLEAKNLITSELSKTVKTPIVDIKILNSDVTVLGEVKLPGKIHLDKEKNTLVEVLGLAGDFDYYGDKKQIQVIRSVNNRTESVTLNLTDLDALSVNNILVHPGDIVYVKAKKKKAWDKTAYSTLVPAASAVTAILLIVKTFF